MKRGLKSWFPRGARLGLLVCLLLSLSLSPVSSALAEGTTPPLAFSQAETLVLNAQSPAAGFFLLNNTAALIPLEITLADFAFVDAGNQPVKDVLALAGDTTSDLLKNDTRRLTLKLNLEALKQVKPGTYSGYVIAAEKGSGQGLARLAVQVVAADAPSGLPNPLFESVSFQALRTFPWSAPECDPSCLLPLNAAALKVDQPLGFLVGPRGEYVQVKARDVTAEDNQPARLRLEFQSLGGAGAYTAKLDLTKAKDKSGVVSVTVNVKDAFWLPLLVLLAGIGAAWWAQRYITVGRKVKDLAERLKKLKDAGLPDIAPYVIDDEKLKKRFLKLAEQIRELKNIAAPSLEDSNEDYKAAVAELDAIESQSALWEDFGGKYKKLENAFKKFPVTNPGPKPSWPTTEGHLPAFYYNAGKLLEKRTVELAEAVSVADKLDKATQLLGSWQQLSGSLISYRERVRGLLGTSALWQPSYQLDLYSADRSICQAWGELWLAEDADNLKERCTNDDILRAEALLLGLHDVHQAAAFWSAAKSAADLNEVLVYRTRADEGDEESREPVPEASVTPLQALFSGILHLFGERVERPADIELEASYSTWLRWWREGVITVIVLLIAVSTAAASLYIGKNFGTFLDYITAFTWGVTSKALVTGLDYAVGRFRGSFKL